jgi:catechol 2,3-dioxygenase-like lactoylglutathione lyase family enzyme
MAKMLASLAAGVVALMALGAAAQQPPPAAPAPEPLIQRIRMATLATPTPDQTVAWYQKWLKYEIADKGTVSEDLARSWGAPKSAGRPYVLLSSAGTPDVYVRVVAIDAVPDFKAHTTVGWSSIEIIVDNLQRLSQEMTAGGANIVRAKAPLDPPFASIHAMQVKGTAEEIVNLASETGDRQKSNLPIPNAQVDRIFLVSQYGPDLDAQMKFYADRFKMRTFSRFDLAIPMVSQALGLPNDTIYPSTLVRSAQRGNTIELHAFPQGAKPRPRAPGQLPPGVALASFAVKSLDIPNVKYITPPAVRDGGAYAGRRAATTTGPAGELIELIEE